MADGTVTEDDSSTDEEVWDMRVHPTNGGWRRWMHLSAWEQETEGMEAVRTGRWRRRVPGPCRMERGSKRRKPDQAQSSILDHVRPIKWNGRFVDLSPDILELVVKSLLLWGEARAIRAMAIVNHSCNAAVNAVLLYARTQILEAARKFAEAKKALTLYPTLSSVYRDEPLAHPQEAFDLADAYEHEYKRRMRHFGIGVQRADQLVSRPGDRWFHNNVSILGHVQDGCELCGRGGTWGTGDLCDAKGIGPVALIACRECSRKNRVRFRLHTDEYYETHGLVLWKWSPDHTQTLHVRFPRIETLANNYACAMLSKRESHRRRMGSHGKPHLRNVPLSRRVHTCTLTKSLSELFDSATDALFNDNNDIFHSGIGLGIELWHSLPPEIPNTLSFASMMGLRDDSETHTQAARVGKARLRARAACDARRASFNKLLLAHRQVVQGVEAVTSDQGYCCWIQVIELCCAARAFDMRWMFRAQNSRFGDWRKARYQILNLEETTIKTMTARIISVVHVLREILTKVSHHPISGGGYTRACVLEVLKHLPESFLVEDRRTLLVAQTYHMRMSHIKLRLRSDANWNGPQYLSVEVEVDPILMMRPRFVMETIVTQYTITRLHSLANKPIRGHRLHNEIVHAAEKVVNHPAMLDSRDQGRAVLFGLPGAWPWAAYWENHVTEEALRSARLAADVVVAGITATNHRYVHQVGGGY